MSLLDIAIALMVLTSPAWAQLPAPSTQPAVKMSALVSGRVVDSQDSAPLEDAVVTIATTVIDGPRPPLERRRQLTDGQGRFSFAGVPAGTYRVTVERSGYLASEYQRTSPEGFGRPFAVSDGQQMTNADVVMWKHASVAGRVTDEAGEPMVGVSVGILRRSFSPTGIPRLSLTQGRTTARTDDRGVYRFGFLGPGSYVVVVSAKVATIPVSVWTSPAAMRGEVSDAIAETALLGSPRNMRVGDHVAAILNSAPVPPAPNTDGRWQVYRTTFHPSALSGHDADTVMLAAGQQRTDVDIRLTPVSTSRVSGLLTGPDGPLASVSLRLVPTSLVGDYEQDPAAASAVTDAAGRFTMLGVPRGQYVLRVLTQPVSPTGRASGDKPSLWVEEPVAVGQDEIRNLSLTARAVPKIQGRITFTGGRPVPSDRITVVVSAADPGPDRTSNPRVEKDHTFAAVLQPGLYTVTAFAGPDTFCTGTTVNGKDVSDEPIEIRDTDLAGVEVRCGDEPARLSGSVQDDKGAAAPAAQVVFFSTDRRHWSGAVPRPRRFGQVRASESGAYSIVNLPDGEYFVTAVTGAIGSLWRDPRQLDALSRTASRVTVVTGEARTQNVRVVVMR